MLLPDLVEMIGTVGETLTSDRMTRHQPERQSRRQPQHLNQRLSLLIPLRLCSMRPLSQELLGPSWPEGLVVSSDYFLPDR